MGTKNDKKEFKVNRIAVIWSFVALIGLNLFPVIMFILNGLHLSTGFSLVGLLFWIGIINFYGIMLISNYLSGSNQLDTGEFRQALTTSFVFTYFLIITISLVPNNNIQLLENKFFDSFSQLTLFIVTYYFGSRIIQDWIGK